MDKKVIAILLKLVVVLMFAVFLFAGWVVIPSYLRFMQRFSPSVGPVFVGVAAYINLSFVPVYCCLLLAWRVFTTLGKDNAFCPENARRLRWASCLALADAGMVFAFYLFLRFGLSLFVGTFFLFITVCLILLGASVALACFALAKLVAQAAELKQEVDLTI